MKRVIPCALMLCVRVIVLLQEQSVSVERHVVAAVLGLSVIVRAMPSGLAAADEPLRLDSGLVSGVRGADPVVRVFKGLPFAAPPVGVLRWRPPQPVRSWVGISQGRSVLADLSTAATRWRRGIARYIAKARRVE